MGIIYKAIDHWNSPTLAHHGVKGMKWGVRHDQYNANKLIRYGKKMDKFKKRYIKVNDKYSKYQTKSYVLQNKINKTTRKIRRINDGKVVYGIWVNDRKKIASLANKNRKMVEKKKVYDSKAIKFSQKSTKYLNKIKQYNRKINKLSNKMRNVNVNELNVSDSQREYINRILFN